MDQLSFAFQKFLLSQCDFSIMSITIGIAAKTLDSIFKNGSAISKKKRFRINLIKKYFQSKSLRNLFFLIFINYYLFLLDPSPSHIKATSFVDILFGTSKILGCFTIKPFLRCHI
ncbi:hypothetical protein BpHYR1_014990 [Brachionus plicatilis]|uniref:Uncharacterized protein n=1 Tax=Brachionus plicatilis TaxID=10195 RepID=A0A3M7RL00_BRAPC|nr:hypothetical protein BpHYR1_014990 [Brachionus plicatilis]